MITFLLDETAWAARREALEEAAAAAEAVGRPVGSGDGNTYIPGSSADAARAIRAIIAREEKKAALAAKADGIAGTDEGASNGA